MADDVSQKTPADIEQEKRDRQAREAAQRQSSTPVQNPLSTTSSNDFSGMLMQFMQMLLGGFGIGNMFGNAARSFSTELRNFSDAMQGRGDTPLAARGSRQNLGVGNTIGTSLRSGWDKVLDVIGQHESGGDYNRVYGSGVRRVNLTDMTIDEVQAWQKKYIREGSPSAAVGKYQIITKTLAGLEKQMGLTGKEKFDEAMQDRMAMQLLENRGISTQNAQTMTTAQIRQAVNSISKEWASIENSSGRGSYDGDGLNKAARGSNKQIAQALQAAVSGEELSRASTARAMDTSTTIKAPSAATDLAKAASAGKPVSGDPVADRRLVQGTSNSPMFVGNYGAANTSPDLRPVANPIPEPGTGPKV